MAPQRWFNSTEHTMNMHPEKNGEECDVPDTINHLLQDCSRKNNDMWLNSAPNSR